MSFKSAMQIEFEKEEVTEKPVSSSLLDSIIKIISKKIGGKTK